MRSIVKNLPLVLAAALFYLIRTPRPRQSRTRRRNHPTAHPKCCLIAGTTLAEN